MKNKDNDFTKAYKEVNINKKLVFFLMLVFAIVAIYPSDSQYYADKEKTNSQYIYFVENYARFANTAAQVILPVVLFDKIGIIQAAYVGLGTFVSVRILKIGLNDIYIKDTRLGERPNYSTSRHNMPSGHSAMATSAMAFVILRYRKWIHLLYLLPISLLTMFTRIELKAHTLSAVIAGAIIGIVVALCLTSKYNWDSRKAKNKFKKEN